MRLATKNKWSDVKNFEVQQTRISQAVERHIKYKIESDFHENAELHLIKVNLTNNNALKKRIQK